MVYVGVEQVVKTLFVGERIVWCASAFLDFFTELNHLVDGLFAGEAVDKFGDQNAVFRFGFAGVEFGEYFDHHGDHDFAPALANERQCAVKIKEH